MSRMALRAALAGFLLVALAACGSSGDEGASHKSPPDPTARLIQQRYGDCLRKLGAKLSVPGPPNYAYDIKGGRLLVISTGKSPKGKVMTFPKDVSDVQILSSVGC